MVNWWVQTKQSRTNRCFVFIFLKKPILKSMAKWLWPLHFLLCPHICDKHEWRGSPCQRNSYFHYCPRIVWEVLARLFWDLIFSLLTQNSLGSAGHIIREALTRLVGEVLAKLIWDSIFSRSHLTIFFVCVMHLISLGPHIFKITPK